MGGEEKVSLLYHSCFSIGFYPFNEMMAFNQSRKGFPQTSLQTYSVQELAPTQLPL